MAAVRQHSPTVLVLVLAVQKQAYIDRVAAVTLMP